MKNMGLITLEGYDENTELILNGFGEDVYLNACYLDGWFKKVKKKVKKTAKKVKKTVKKTTKSVSKAVPAKAIVKIAEDARNSGVYKTVAVVNKKLASNPVVRTAAITTATVYGGPAGGMAAKMALDQASGKKLNFKQLASSGGLDLAVNALATVNPEAAAAANEYMANAKEIKNQYSETVNQLDKIKNTNVLTAAQAAAKSALIEKYGKRLSELNYMFNEQAQKGVNEAKKIEESYKNAVIDQYAAKEGDKKYLSTVYDQVQKIQNNVYAQTVANNFKIEPEYVYTGILS